MKYTSVPKKSVERKCKWAIWTILRKKYRLCVKNRAIIVAKAVAWLPWYFWENMWLWCSSRLFPCCSSLFIDHGKKWGVFFTPGYHILSNFMIALNGQHLSQLENRLEVCLISGSNEWSKLFTVFNKFLQV